MFWFGILFNIKSANNENSNNNYNNQRYMRAGSVVQWVKQLTTMPDDNPISISGISLMEREDQILQIVKPK